MTNYFGDMPVNSLIHTAITASGDNDYLGPTYALCAIAQALAALAEEMNEMTRRVDVLSLAVAGQPLPLNVMGARG